MERASLISYHIAFVFKYKDVMDDKNTTRKKSDKLRCSRARNPQERTSGPPQKRAVATNDHDLVHISKILAIRTPSASAILHPCRLRATTN